MKNTYFKNTFFALVLIAVFAVITPAIAKISALNGDSLVIKSTLKFKDSRPDRPVFHKLIKTDFDAFLFKMTALKTGINPDGTFSGTKNVVAKNSSVASLESQKPIDNVKVYPNPVSDQLNLSYTLKKESLVTIKILDVLGNEVVTLFNQRQPAGAQNNKFTIDTKLNTGFYFVRIIAGSDSIVKRISVL